MVYLVPGSSSSDMRDMVSHLLHKSPQQRYGEIIDCMMECSFIPGPLSGFCYSTEKGVQEPVNEAVKCVKMTSGSLSLIPRLLPPPAFGNFHRQGKCAQVFREVVSN